MKKMDRRKNIGFNGNVSCFDGPIYIESFESWDGIWQFTLCFNEENEVFQFFL